MVVPIARCSATPVDMIIRIMPKVLNPVERSTSGRYVLVNLIEEPL